MSIFSEKHNLVGLAVTEILGFRRTDIVLLCNINVCRTYVDIMTGENYHQFSLLTWNSFNGQFFHPVGGEGTR